MCDSLTFIDRLKLLWYLKSAVLVRQLYTQAAAVLYQCGTQLVDKAAETAFDEELVDLFDGAVTAIQDYLEGKLQ